MRKYSFIKTILKISMEVLFPASSIIPTIAGGTLDYAEIILLDRLAEQQGKMKSLFNKIFFKRQFCSDEFGL